MTLSAGDSFFAPWPEGGVDHLFFVISDPAADRERVVVVPMMTWDDHKESTCRIEKGGHKFVKHSSYIDYRCAREVRLDYIEIQIRSKKFRKMILHPRNCFKEYAMEPRRQTSLISDCETYSKNRDL